MLGKLSLANLLFGFINGLVYDGLDTGTPIRVILSEVIAQFFELGFSTFLIYMKDQSVTVKNKLLTKDFSYLTDICVPPIYLFYCGQ